MDKKAEDDAPVQGMTAAIDKITEEASDWIFVGVLFAIFGFGVMAAVSSWGWLSGLLFGSVIFGLIAGTVFYIGLDRPSFRGGIAGITVLIVVGIVLLTWTG